MSFGRGKRCSTGSTYELDLGGASRSATVGRQGMFASVTQRVPTAPLVAYQ